MKNVGIKVYTLIAYICIVSLSVADAQDATLKVLSATPRGATNSLENCRTIVVTFDRPVVPLQSLPDTFTEGPLNIDPAIEGTYRWLGTSTLAFTADEALPYATSYRVSVSEDLATVEGHTLRETYQWTFQTPRPRLIGYYPSHGAQGVRLDGEIVLYFTVPMSLDRAHHYLEVKDLTSATEVPFSLRFPTSDEIARDRRVQGDSTRVIVLSPLVKLARAHAYQVTVAKAMPAAEGGLGTTEATLFSFETYGALRFAGFRSELARDPHSSVEFRFTNPVKTADLVQHITITPEVTVPAYYADWQDEGRNVALTLPFKPDTSYIVRISPELQDSYGNRLGEEQVIELITGPYPPRLIMTAGPGVLEADGDIRYPLEFVNMKKAQLNLARIAPGKLIPLLKNPSLFFSETKQPDSLFLLQRTLPLSGRRNVREVAPIEISRVLEDSPYGVVLVQVDNLLSKEQRQIFTSLLQVTEMGISAKFSPDNNIVWVTNLADASPVAGATVEIRDDANTILFRAETDSSGAVSTPGWKRLGVKLENQWQRPRQWAFVYNGDDFAYTASDWGTGIYPYRFGINYDWRAEPELMKGLLFTDRNMYRPGDSVRVKGLFRHKEYGVWKVSEGRAVHLKVFDSRNEKLLERSIELSDFGSLDIILPIGENAPLGYYRILADTSGGNEESYYSSVAQGSFRVEEFRTAEFEVSVRLDRESYIAGDSLETKIHGKYLFGGGMSGQPAEWYVRLSRRRFTPPGYENYFFDSWSYFADSYRFTSQLVASGETTLDENGGAALASLLPDVPTYSATHVTVSADVEGPSRRHITGGASALVHPGAYYIGVQPQSTLGVESRPFSYKVVTVDARGNVVADKSIRVSIYQRQYHSVRKAGLAGRYEWISKKVDTLVDSLEIVTDATVRELTFRPEKSGNYLIVTRGVDARGNRILSSAQFYISGREYAAWQRKDDDRIELIADKEKYAPGETATLLVQSPFESAEALITIEREGILRYYTRHLEGSAPAISVLLEEEYLPNIFVSVILLKGRVSQREVTLGGEDIGRPAFKIGYINLPVDPGLKHLSVEVETDKSSYLPGERVSLDIQIEGNEGRPSELTVAVVDAGVLALSDYEFPDPFALFYGERPLSVQTSETRLHVVEQRNYGEKGENRGGGGALEGAFAGIDMRTRFVATAYWNPSLRTDERGKTSLSFTLPDNLTRFKVMVLAHTRDNCFGTGSTELEVKKPLLLQSALPRFARVGDAFEAGVVVQNFTESDGKVSVQMSAQGVRSASKSKRTVKLEAGAGIEVRFPVTAEKAGRATFQFSAKMGEYTDGLEIALPVREPRLAETVATSSRIETSRDESITIPGDSYPDMGELEVWVSSSALTDLSGSAEYLFTYPYGCLEQRVSSALPMILAGEMVEAFDLPALRGADIKSVVKEILAELGNYQLSNGGFAFWPGGIRDYPYASAYACYALLRASENGYEVDKGMLERGLKYLHEYLRREYRSGTHPFGERVWHSARVFALYVLALAGREEPGYRDQLYEQRAGLPLFARAMLLKALFLSGESTRADLIAGELLNDIRIEAASAHFEEHDPAGLAWAFHSEVRSTAIILQALLETRGGFQHDEKVVHWLLQRRKAGRWRTTQENIYVLHALASYFEVYEKTAPNFSAAIRIAGKTLLEASFEEYSLRTSRRSASLKDFKKETLLPVEIEKEGEGRLYYGMRMRYYPLQPLETRDGGLSLLKTVTAFNDSSWRGPSFRPGSLVQIELRVITPQGRNFVVVDDPLPAGFEAVNISLATESEELARQLRETRREHGVGEIWWGGFNHTETRDDRVLLYADYLSAGVFTYTYLARAITYGTFVMPATHAELMYEPEVFGRLAGGIIEIVK